LSQLLSKVTETNVHCVHFDDALKLATPLITGAINQTLQQFAPCGALQGGPKTDIQFYFWDNFSNSAPISTILSLLQAEIYGA